MTSLQHRKIVVTGGAGFIGSHIVKALLREGAHVIVVDDLSTGNEANMSDFIDRITWIRGSVCDVELMQRACTDAYAVVHQAALPSVPKSVAFPLETNQANSTGTLAVFVAAQRAGVDRVIYASSSSVYGDTAVLPKEESMPLNPLSPYAVQKMTTELYGRIFHSLHGLKTIGLRYFNVFGPRQNPNSEYAAVIPKFITEIKRGKSPRIFGDGEQTRDFTYVDNVVQANIRALQAESGFGEAYNVACGGHISLNELVARINKILSTSITPEYLSPRTGDIRDSYADISKARDVLGFVPTVGFDEGLKKTADSL